MNTLHDEVRSWLDSLFPNRDVPSFEVNEANLQALSDLARYSKERERDIGNINKVRQRQTEEYRAEADRTTACLEKIGLTPDQISGPASSLLSSLADCALLLDLDSAGEADLSLRLAQVQSQTALAPLDHWRWRRADAEARKKQLDTLKESCQNASYLKSVEISSAKKIEADSHSRKKIEFMTEKQREYAKTAQRLETSLLRSGLKKEVCHESLVAAKEKLDALETELKPLKLKLESYKELPPDVELAKVKVAEARQELAELTQKLTSEISMLHI